MSEPGGPWPLAGLVGARIAGSNPLAGSYHAAVLSGQLGGIVTDVEPLVAEETGLVGLGLPEVAVIDRGTWVKRNLGFMHHVLERHEATLGVPSPRAAASGAMESAALLGFLARRVLGQYELVLPTGDEADTIYLVGDNVLLMEREHQFNPTEFRTWIMLHECAHRAQFTGVPWLRGYFLSLVDDIISSSGHDHDRIERILQRLLAAARREAPLIDEQGVFGIVASPEQRSHLDRVQALMSLLEGHGHVVMDRIGARLLPTQARMSSILKRRRAEPRMALLLRLAGIEMKMRQYELGEKFVLGVEERAGWSALGAAWTSPEALPTLREIEDPGRWLARVA